MQYYWLNYRPFSLSTSFSPYVLFFCPSIQFRIPHCTSSMYLFTLLQSATVPQSCLSWPWYFWWVLVILLQNVPQCGFVWRFLIIKQKLYMFGGQEHHRSDAVSFSVHYVGRGTWCPQTLVLVMLTLITWLSWWMPVFSTVKLLCFSL